jgi:iron complex outermembrane receptor protein/vitamin B12 transporter
LLLAVLALVVATLAVPASASAAETATATIRGVVTDPAGAMIRGATVYLLQGNTRIASTITGPEGNFQLSVSRPGRYSIQASAPGFALQRSPLVYVSAGKTVTQDLALAIGSFSERIVVTATGVAVPESQVGASVSVVSSDQFQEKLEALEPLRQVPGVQVLEHGQRGIAGSLFIRGGESNDNKVLLDGVPVNEIGGTVDFGSVFTTGLDRMELMRGPNSVLYGADALAGVLSMTTSRGVTPLPRLSYSFDAGNFSSLHHDASLGGVFRQFDYFSEFSRFDTANSEPNSTFHNSTYAGSFGWTPSTSTDLRLTVRRVAATVGEPNAIDFFGIPDDSFLAQHNTYVSATLQNQTTSHWHNLLRYGATRLDSVNVNPTPSGILDPIFGNFLGKVVTIRGANGFSTTGQAILDFAGAFPQITPILTNRDFADIQSDYVFNPHLTALFGFRYENERVAPIERKNFSYTGELHGSLWNRLYATAGFGVEDNAVFGGATTPRVSLAYYLVRPQSGGRFNGTKLKFNYGQGIKEVEVFFQQSSLFDLLSKQPGGAQTISQFHIAPIGPERSRGFDFGLEQFAWNGRARLGLSFFHNRFTDLVEFISDLGTLEKLGVPAKIATDVISAPPFGASVNSLATRALGAETEIEVALGHGFSARAAYTYLDSVVERSFSSDNLFPSFNPAFPTIPIGAFSPLVGNRPFNRAPHVGSFYLGYTKPKFTLTLSGNLVSRRDGSTFLSDASFGNTMLLPNRNLQQGYQKVDLSASYRLNRHVELYSLVQNLASQRYDPIIGFPALPLNFRTGVRFTVGGESWK